MKYIDEFRDQELVQEVVRRIQGLAGAPATIMEVCGTHTMAAARFGLKSLLPEAVQLISGPGCPVCVTAQTDIDAFLALGDEPGVILTSFGDMLRVPGSHSLPGAPAGPGRRGAGGLCPSGRGGTGPPGARQTRGLLRGGL